MQRSWRQDADKLTFIACRPVADSVGAFSNNSTEYHHRQHHDNNEGDGDGIGCLPTHLHPEHDSPANMLGDINLFLRIDDGADGDAPPQIIGEIELMIAEKENQRRGFGKAMFLTFLRYIIDHQQEILNEFVRGGIVEAETLRKLKATSASSANTETDIYEGLAFSCLSVKIGQSNTRSLALFESLSFEKVAAEPNFFGEFELRRDLRRDVVDEDIVEGFVEIAYDRRA